MVQIFQSSPTISHCTKSHNKHQYIMSLTSLFSLFLKTAKVEVMHTYSEGILLMHKYKLWKNIVLYCHCVVVLYIA